MNMSLKYQAISSGKMDLTDVFQTDGQLKAFDLKVLKDDKHFFPPYYAAPIVRDETLKKYPKLREALDSLGGKISDETMRELNYRVDNKKENVASVAEDFLKKSGLL